jgi:hypothetical protein
MNGRPGNRPAFFFVGRDCVCRLRDHESLTHESRLSTGQRQNLRDKLSAATATAPGAPQTNSQPAAFSDR